MSESTALFLGSTYLTIAEVRRVLLLSYLRMGLVANYTLGFIILAYLPHILDANTTIF